MHGNSVIDLAFTDSTCLQKLFASSGKFRCFSDLLGGAGVGLLNTDAVIASFLGTSKHDSIIISKSLISPF